MSGRGGGPEGVAGAAGLWGRVGEGGAVVVTLFACRTRRDIALIWWLHRRIKPAVRAHAHGFVDVRLFIDWRHRLVRSVSLWTDPAHLYEMGRVSDHVGAARIPARRGIRTSCAIYTCEGECMEVMFGSPAQAKPAPLAAEVPASWRAGREGDPDPATGMTTSSPPKERNRRA
jgi:hypothetical protein